MTESAFTEHNPTSVHASLENSSLVESSLHVSSVYSNLTNQSGAQNAPVDSDVSKNEGEIIETSRNKKLDESIEIFENNTSEEEKTQHKYVTTNSEIYNDFESVSEDEILNEEPYTNTYDESSVEGFSKKHNSKVTFIEKNPYKGTLNKVSNSADAIVEETSTEEDFEETSNEKDFEESSSEKNSEKAFNEEVFTESLQEEFITKYLNEEAADKKISRKKASIDKTSSEETFISPEEQLSNKEILEKVISAGERSIEEISIEEPTYKIVPNENKSTEGNENNKDFTKDDMLKAEEEPYEYKQTVSVKNEETVMSSNENQKGFDSSENFQQDTPIIAYDQIEYEKVNSKNTKTLKKSPNIFNSEELTDQNLSVLRTMNGRTNYKAPKHKVNIYQTNLHDIFVINNFTNTNETNITGDKKRSEPNTNFIEVQGSMSSPRVLVNVTIAREPEPGYSQGSQSVYVLSISVPTNLNQKPDLNQRVALEKNENNGSNLNLHANSNREFNPNNNLNKSKLAHEPNTNQKSNIDAKQFSMLKKEFNYIEGEKEESPPTSSSVNVLDEQKLQDFWGGKCQCSCPCLDNDSSSEKTESKEENTTSDSFSDIIDESKDDQSEKYTTSKNPLNSSVIHYETSLDGGHFEDSLEEKDSLEDAFDEASFEDSSGSTEYSENISSTKTVPSSAALNVTTSNSPASSSVTISTLSSDISSSNFSSDSSITNSSSSSSTTSSQSLDTSAPSSSTLSPESQSIGSAISNCSGLPQPPMILILEGRGDMK